MNWVSMLIGVVAVLLVLRELRAVANTYQECTRTLKEYAFLEGSISLDRLRTAVIKDRASIMLDVRSIDARQAHQETLHWDSMARLLEHLRLIPVYNMGQVVSYRKAGKNEKIDLRRDWQNIRVDIEGDYNDGRPAHK